MTRRGSADLNCEYTSRAPPLAGGTSTLFAALEIGGACKLRHRHQEFLAFLTQVSRAYPEGELHLVMDNDVCHRRRGVRARRSALGDVCVDIHPASGSALEPACLMHHLTAS